MSARPATPRPSPEELRRAALDYAARGVPILPLRGKLPLIPAAHRPGDPAYQQCKGDCGRQGHGVHDASTDLEQVCHWWDRWPGANIGLRTGVAFDVIDIDGVQGRRSLERFLVDHGGLVSIGGPRVRTGSRGWHLYVRPSGLPDRIGVLDSVDYRAADHYVVAPPSRHPTTGRRYQWVPGRHLDDTLLGELPLALRERLTPRATERQPAPPRPVRAANPYGRAVLQAETARIASARGPGQGRGGQRNQVLWEAARNLYNLVAGGVLDQADVERELELAAGACGLLRDEPRQTMRTIASARRVGMAHPRGVPEQPAGTARGRDRHQRDASHHPPFHPSPERGPSPERRALRSPPQGGDAPATHPAGRAVAPNPARNRATAPDPTAHPRQRRQTVGPIPTLPPHPQPPPNNRNQHPLRPSPHADHDLVLDVDQPATSGSERDADPALEEAALRAYHELTEADQTRPIEEPEPPGRRLPQALDAAREGVER